MHPRLLPVLLLFAAVPLRAQVGPDLERLAQTMAGSYTSAAQAAADSSYFPIELEMVRIWPERGDAAWLYVEQAMASTKGKPYRQRVYRLRRIGEGQFESAIFSIPNGESWFGAYRSPGRFTALSPDSLSVLSGCEVILQVDGPVYRGGTQGKSCPSTRAGASYTTSEVLLREGRMESWDRGWSAADTQVWGAERGGYIFLKYDGQKPVSLRPSTSCEAQR